MTREAALATGTIGATGAVAAIGAAGAVTTVGVTGAPAPAGTACLAGSCVDACVDTATGRAASAELSSERVYKIFSKIARRYGRFNAVSSFGLYRSWLRGMVGCVPMNPAARVLDLAGGTGDVTFALARKRRPAHIQLTDLVPAMLEVAKARHSKGAGQGTPIGFEVVDAQRIPYEDESFDVVTVAYGIRNMPERSRALTEMHRVLRPGGRLVCLEFSRPRTRVTRAFYHFYLKHLIPFWGGLIAGDREGFVYLSDSIKAFPDQAGLAAMFEDAGFTQVTWTNYSGGIAAVHVGVK